MNDFLRTITILSLAVAAGHWLGVSSRGSALGGTDESRAEVGNVEVSVSSSGTCAVPSGPYTHIYITLADISASRSPTFSTGDGSVVDLTPRLAAHPEQIDLLEKSGGNCFLAMLGGGTTTAGAYRSLRVTVLQSASELGEKSEKNHCSAAGTPNCVVLAGGAVLPIDFPDGDWFGIGSREIAGGEFVVRPGGTVQLNISVDACDSVVSEVSPETNGRYVFAASARASLLDRATAIGGRVVDAATGEAIDGRVMVAIERKGEDGVDRIVSATTPGPDGSFLLCPVARGEYDLAALAVSGKRTSYGPVILLNVPAGAALGEIGLEPSAAINAQPATVVGQVSLLAGTNVGFGNVRITALTSAGDTGRMFAIPLPQSTAGTLRVKGPGAIPYSFTVPAINPRIGVFSVGRAQFSQDTTGAPAFFIEADGCGTTKTTDAAIPVTAGGTASAPILTISTCNPIPAK